MQPCAESPFCCQNAPECTKPRSTFQKFYGGNTADPTLRLCAPRPPESGGRDGGKKGWKGAGEGREEGERKKGRRSGRDN